MCLGGGAEVGGGAAGKQCSRMSPTSSPGSMSTALKTPMAEVNAKMALLRLRLYRTLISLPPAAFEGRFFVVQLLR